MSMFLKSLAAAPDATSHQQRLASFEQVAVAKGWRVVQDTTIQFLDGSCLYNLTYQSRHYENHIIGDGWEYLEIGFKSGSLTGFHRPGNVMVHYGVMSVKLPRSLPNVVFDSLKHQRQQFRLLFDKKQYIQLEGNFDKYFATYFGSDYMIDDLSFITPEVMEALISADDYDIEIIHDHLLLFGSIKADGVAQVEEMSAALQLIRKKLLNNILTYRDERIPYAKGRQVVARAGMFLDLRPYSNFRLSLIFIFIVARIMVGAFIVVLVVLAIERVLDSN